MNTNTPCQLDLFTTEATPVVTVRRLRSMERSRDSSGAYASDVEISPEEMAETERRRQLAVVKKMRIMEEELIELRSELKRYKNNN